MNISQKLELFELLVEIGFKEIEIGFPSASETEFNFVRKLVDENLIPEGVKLQCLVQAREHLIRRTFEAISGVPNAIVHIYNSTSPLQRDITFGGATKDEIKSIAVEGTKLIKELVSKTKNIPHRYRIDTKLVTKFAKTSDNRHITNQQVRTQTGHRLVFSAFSRPRTITQVDNSAACNNAGMARTY